MKSILTLIIVNKVYLKNHEEIELIRESSLIVSKTLGMLAAEIKPGVNGLELDKLANTFIRDHGGIPGFLGLYDFPNTLCVIVVVVNSNKKPFENGDIVSIDCGVLKNGFYGDHAYTFPVGEINTQTKKLLKITKESLYIGISKFNKNNRVGDLSYSIQKHNEDNGFGVVRELVGHDKIQCMRS